VRLADGRSARVAAVTYGKNHEYWEGGVAARWFGGLMPPNWTRRLGWISVKHVTSEPRLIVWLHWETPMGSSGPAQYISFTDGKSETDPSHYLSAAYPKRWETVVGIEGIDFPRRDERIGVRIYDKDNASRLHKRAEFWVTNPVRVRLPARAPNPFPLRASTNGLSFAFENAVCREGKSSALFRVEGAGAGDWKVESLEIRDETGNYFQPRRMSFTRVGEYLEVEFQKAWWRSQTNYDWTVEFSRERAFRPNEIFAVAITNLPPPGTQSLRAGTVHSAGDTIVVAEINRDLPRGTTWDVEVILQVIPPVAGLQISLINAISGTNSAIPTQAGYVLPNGRRAYFFDLPEKEEDLKVTFALQRTVRVEFKSVPAPRR
jgi:hypothetical protein